MYLMSAYCLLCQSLHLHIPIRHGPLSHVLQQAPRENGRTELQGLLRGTSPVTQSIIHTPPEQSAKP